jgi:hypothetical protein
MVDDLSGFPNDVFISYTHRDNSPDDPGDPATGWVSRFHRELQVRLTELLGREAKVWRDPKLGAVDVFSHELTVQLKRTAVLVPVLSPGYDRSEWCHKELAAFQEAAEAQGGFEVHNKVRAAKVIKTPLDGERHREIVPGALGRAFFEQLADSGYIREFEPESAEFRNGVDLLAQDIKRVLDALGGQRAVKVAERGVVFLAETTRDLKAERERLREELIAFQYRVLPEDDLPDDMEAIDAAVKSALGQARLSVHLFGGRYGVIPELADQSVPILQYQIAQERGLARIAWIKPVGDAPETRQADFLESLREAPGAGLELLEHRTVEDLKDRVLTLLTPRAPEPKPPSDGLVRIYMMCDQDDHPLARRESTPARKVRDYLVERGFEVKLPVTGMGAEPSRVRRDNQEKLKQCDAVLLFWGTAPDVWVEEKLREVTKAVGWRGARPFAAKALYVTAPTSLVKEGYTTLEAQLIRHFDEFDPALLVSFVDPLKGAGRAPA